MLLSAPGRTPYEIHPLLKNEINFTRSFLWIVSVLYLGMVAAGALLGYYSPWWIIPLLLIFAVLASYLPQTLLKPLYRANKVVLSTEPVPMEMKSLGVIDHKGYYAELKPPQSGQQTLPRAVVVLEAGRHKPVPREAVQVRYYVEGGAADDFIVVETDKRIFPGRLTTPQSRAEFARRFAWIYFGLTLLLPAAVTILAIEQVTSYRSNQAQWQLAQVSSQWPRAKGEITSSSIREVRISRGRNTVKGFEAAVEYKYTTGSRTYQGQRIHFGYEPSTDKTQTIAIVNRYPIGQQVEVAYRPAHPETAVLETGHAEDCLRLMEKARTGLIVAIVGGVTGVSVLIGVWLFLAWRRKKAFRELPP